MRDMIRVAQFHGIPFAAPNPDPIVQDMMTRKIADEQPHIYWLTRLGQAAAREGKGLVFADEASRLIWGGTGSPASSTGSSTTTPKPLSTCT